MAQNTQSQEKNQAEKRKSEQAHGSPSKKSRHTTEEDTAPLLRESSTEVITDTEPFPEFEDRERPFPYIHHCTLHCKHKICYRCCTHMRIGLPQCTCSQVAPPSPSTYTPAQLDIEAIIANIKAGNSILPNLDDKAEITIYEHEFEAIMFKLEANDILDSRQVYNTNEFQSFYNYRDERAQVLQKLLDTVVLELLQSFYSAFGNKWMRTVSLHDLNLELCGCLGVMMEKFAWDHCDDDLFRGEYTTETFIAGRASELLKQSRLVLVFWQAWGRFVDALIEILVRAHTQRA